METPQQKIKNLLAGPTNLANMVIGNDTSSSTMKNEANKSQASIALIVQLLDEVESKEDQTKTAEAEELWDKYSERIGSDIDDLDRVAGKDVIFRTQFIEVIANKEKITPKEIEDWLRENNLASYQELFTFQGPRWSGSFPHLIDEMLSKLKSK